MEFHIEFPPNRTLTPNSKDGSDHGWSGNTFMMGGSLNGGRILGTYPTDLSDKSPINIGMLSVLRSHFSHYKYFKSYLSISFCRFR